LVNIYSYLTKLLILSVVYREKKYWLDLDISAKQYTHLLWNVNTYKELVARVSIEEIHRLHRTSRDKIVYCLQRRFICYTRLVVIN
jgi:hypothetical protein